ncbi:MAG: glycosyltransferase [Anaerolineales bacterium]|nr:glycosyltransferase [Anaerolineales bacterium]HJO33831.1 glycosyltransferase [Anaerolineales bacterium]
MTTDCDILILSTQDWDALPTRKHHWARKFAARGNRVLYVEQQMHWLGWLVDFRRQFRRVWRWLSGPRQVSERLWVFTLPVVLPFFQMFALINALNNRLLAPVLRWALRRIGFKDIVLWAYTPHAAGLVGRLGEQFMVYECVDEFSATRGLVRGETVTALERQLLRMADRVIVTHPSLLRSKTVRDRRPVLVPNGADINHFARAGAPGTRPAAAVAALPRPVVGFHGWIQYWIDFDLIAHSARKHPEWSFALIGPVEPLARVDKVRGLTNVHFLGKQPYERMPEFLAGFDVCINPFVLGELADAVSPIKLYEYLASGKPVVSVDMPAAREFSDLITLVRTPEQFVRALEDVLFRAQNGIIAAGAAARRQAAGGFSWDARFQQVEEQLEGALVERPRRG